MIQGTGSNVGKSLITAGLCRAFVRQGLSVAPFKPQNMSNNAAVARDGGEIGRAQALQAQACGLAPETRMNPILLKPEAGHKAQLIVNGHVIGRYSAREYHKLKPQMLDHAKQAYCALAAKVDLVLIEGAGSPAEVNLRAGDIANMGFAEAVDAPVLLVADIHRGGIIASVVGTHLLLDPSEQERLIGYIINQFRGDISLFTPACDIMQQHTGMPCLGIVPYFEAATHLPAEDAMEVKTRCNAGAKLKIAVPRLARIANFDDLDPLISEPMVDVQIIAPGTPLPRDADLIILPGSKDTLSDLYFLRAQGWDIDIRAHVRHGGAVLGICAGYQMLGEMLYDPERLEGSIAEIEGLGLLRLSTTMAGMKHLNERSGHDRLSGGVVRGYEMHLGVTTGADCTNPMLYIDETPFGARSANGLVMGCYLHGLFADEHFRGHILKTLNLDFRQKIVYRQQVEDTLDALANHLEAHMDLERLLPH